MRDDGSGVSQRKPSRHDMLVWAGREVAKAIQASANPLVTAAGARMVAQGAPIHTRRECLLGREVAGLGLGGPVERIMVYVVHKGDYITLMSDTTSGVLTRMSRRLGHLVL